MHFSYSCWEPFLVHFSLLSSRSKFPPFIGTLTAGIHWLGPRMCVGLSLVTQLTLHCFANWCSIIISSWRALWEGISNWLCNHFPLHYIVSSCHHCYHLTITTTTTATNIIIIIIIIVVVIIIIATIINIVVVILLIIIMFVMIKLLCVSVFLWNWSDSLVSLFVGTTFALKWRGWISRRSRFD